MKQIRLTRVVGWALILWFVSPLPGRAAQFVELTTEIQISDWDYMFLCDRNSKYPGEAGTPAIFTDGKTRRCVVGTDTWMIESTFDTSKDTRWFTGTNIIAHTVITKQTPGELVRKISEKTRLATGTAPAVGHKYTRIHDSVDGNPGRPGGVADLAGFDLPASISWLAFCSGQALQREGRRIFPPSPMWKESALSFSGWSDSTEVFKDDLGLPRSINLIATNGQPVFQYQVRKSTNVLGWTIPLEFYGVQYLPAANNTWKVHLTFKGRVSSVAPATRPEIPADVMKVIEK